MQEQEQMAGHLQEEVRVREELTMKGFDTMNYSFQ
jgi:hypothetical protein